MLFEGVAFVEPSVKKMTKEAFVEAHKDVFWLDRDVKEREKMLSDVYDTIVGKEEAPEPKEEKKAKGAKK
ncbi:MAG: hypothetical protein J5733_02245 [Bacteroidaceae bacterium]|nr:hypothetical protein [Bacteroidaceae bacterium]